MESKSMDKLRLMLPNRHHHLLEKIEHCSHWLLHSESTSFSLNNYCSKLCVCKKILSLVNLEKLLQRKNTKIAGSVCTDPLIDGAFESEANSNNQLHCLRCFASIRLGDTMQSAIFFMPDYECTKGYLQTLCMLPRHVIGYDSAARHFHLISHRVLSDQNRFFKYLLYGIPRCLYDLNLFTFEIISVEDFSHPFEDMSNPIKYVCYLGFPFDSFAKNYHSFSEVITSNGCQNFISVYYVKQKCPYVQRFEVWKKLVINWAEVDLPYCFYHKHSNNNKFADYLTFLYNGHHYDFTMQGQQRNIYSSLVKPFYKCRKKVRKWKFAYCNNALIQGAYRIGLKPYQSTCIKITDGSEPEHTDLGEAKSRSSGPSMEETTLLETNLQDYLSALKESFEFMQAKSV